MKAIINIKNKRNQYAKFNNLTFEVKELMSGSVGILLLQGDFNQTDFSFDEIIIINFLEELNKAEDSRIITNLLAYARHKKINLMVKYGHLDK